MKMQNRKLSKLKGMYEHLVLVNKRLCAQLKKLKNVSRDIQSIKLALRRKYCKKIKKLVTAQHELRDIFKVNRTISSEVDLKKAYGLVTRLTCELMHTDVCVLRINGSQKSALSVNSKEALIKKNIFLAGDKELSSGVMSSKRPLMVYNLTRAKDATYKAVMTKEGFQSILSVPVMFRDKALGVISTYSKKLRSFTKEELEVLSIFASNLAMAIHETKHYKDIHLSYFNAIHALVLTLEARDPYTHGHTERVTQYALEIARALHMAKKEIEILRCAAEVHDIGKVSIPDFILNKPGKLTPAERAIIQLHAAKGAEMLEPLEFLRPAVNIVRHHHERYDGKGYPDGLRDGGIPMMSRILACADSFDAMTSERPYRENKLTLPEAIREIKDNAGSQFDPHIAQLFIQALRKKPYLRKAS